MFYKYYLYNREIDLLFDNGTLTCSCNATENAPMNDNIIRIYKGMDNTIKFNVFDSDRKKVRIDYFDVIATLVNVENQERVLQKKARITSAKGNFLLDIEEREIADLAPGFYSFFISGKDATNEDSATTPFYTDLATHINMSVEILPAIDMTPIPTKEVGVKDWLSQQEIILSMVQNVYYSAAFPANRIKNNTKASHTFAVNMNDFTGKFYMLGSLEQLPPTDPNEYFRIDFMGDGVEHQFTHETSFNYYTIESNLRWIKFSWVPDLPIVDQFYNPISLTVDNSPILKVYLRA